MHPVDTAVGRRPARLTRPGSIQCRRRVAAAGALRHRPAPGATPIGAILFPDGEPPTPEAMHVNGKRMDVRYVVGVLMGNRDLVRRLAAEQEASMAP